MVQRWRRLVEKGLLHEIGFESRTLVTTRSPLFTRVQGLSTRVRLFRLHFVIHVVAYVAEARITSTTRLFDGTR